MRLSTLTALIVLLPSSFVSAQTQDTLQGIEISAGQIIGKYRLGATFITLADGSLPGLMTVSVNYTPNSPGPNVNNVIVGGAWTLAVVQNRRIVGTLYGTVPSGLAAWNADGTVANISADLKILGGTGQLARRRGTGQFLGLLSHETFPPTIGGTLNLAF